MGHASIPVDLFNPGQVFACLGLLEAAEVLLGPSVGGFDGSDTAGTRFHLRAPGEDDPVLHVLRFLESAEVYTLAPPGSQHTTHRWNVDTRNVPHGTPYPFPNPSSPATLPAVLRAHGHELVLDHWGDVTIRDNVKFWAGAGGYPGAGLLRDALDLVRGTAEQAAADPFEIAAAQSSSFRFDWRRDYVPMGIGFSLNEHSGMQPRGYPWVEILAALGLMHARPLRPDRRDKLTYRYAVLGGTDLPLALHRAALGCTPLPFPTRTFRMCLSWPGQEGHERCITDVVEET